MRLIVRLVELGRARPDRTAVIVLALLPFLLWAPALWPGRVLTPVDQLFLVAPWSAVAPARPQANPALADVSQVFHPWTLYTARVQPADAPRIFTGKQAMVKPCGGSTSRLWSFSRWQ